tara:strand:+ start:1576 stop:2022 length:447 start_codon:yes stop_codon:yes gene_type:complete
MATSTLIQSLIIGADADQSARSKRETFLAGGTIAKGDFVSLDSSQTGADRALYVKVIDTSGGAVAIGVPTVGVAMNAASAGGQVVVVVAGYAEGANVATGSTANLALTLDTTTSGRATIAAAANVNIAAIALENATSNAADVWVMPSI